MNEQIKTIIILIYVIFSTSMWKYCPVSVFGYTESIGFWIGSTKIIVAFILFGMIPMGIVKFVFREKLASYGIRFGITKLTIRSFLITAPFIVLIAYLTGKNPAFFDVYPFSPFLRSERGNIEWELFTIHAILYFGYYFGWEFLFRGFLQHGISSRCGIEVAILVQTLASTMLHYGHPPSE
ncbi:MAG: hypothetical protein ACRCUY_13965, partial [Thermoguttaceae bacterium]